LVLKIFQFKGKYGALIRYLNGAHSYILLPYGLFIGSYVNTQVFLNKFYSKNILGKQVPLKFLKKFTIFFNINLKVKKRAYYAISSGVYCTLLSQHHEFNLVKVKLPSAKQYFISNKSFCTLGRNSNLFKKYQVLGTHRLNLMKGFKSVVRGVAMNPVDHPHGGRTKTNSPELSIWGWVAKISH